MLQYPIKEYYRKLEHTKFIRIKNIIKEDKKVTTNKNFPFIRNLSSYNYNNVKIAKLVIDNFNKNVINNKIMIIYKINIEETNLKVLGKEFIKNNKGNCKFVINKKEYDICEYIEYDKYNINKNDHVLAITLKGINTIINAKDMFYGCSSLLSLPDISKWETKNVTNINGMFGKCSLLKKFLNGSLKML